MLRRLYDEARDGNDGHASGKKYPCMRERRHVLKRDRDRDKDKQPVDFHRKFPIMDCWNIGRLEYCVLNSIIPVLHHSIIPISALSVGFAFLNGLNFLNDLNVWNLFLWLPPAAKGAVKLNDGVELNSARARKFQFGIKEILVGNQNFEIVC